MMSEEYFMIKGILSVFAEFRKNNDLKAVLAFGLQLDYIRRMIIQTGLRKHPYIFLKALLTTKIFVTGRRRNGRVTIPDWALW